MSLSDPIADMLTRIRNAVMVRHESVLIPASKMKLDIAKILKEEGFINDYEVIRGKPYRTIKVNLKYSERNQSVISGLERVSKPGLRIHVQQKRYSTCISRNAPGVCSLLPGQDRAVRFLSCLPGGSRRSDRCCLKQADRAPVPTINRQAGMRPPRSM